MMALYLPWVILLLFSLLALLSLLNHSLFIHLVRWSLRYLWFSLITFVHFYHNFNVLILFRTHLTVAILDICPIIDSVKIGAIFARPGIWVKCFWLLLILLLWLIIRSWSLLLSWFLGLAKLLMIVVLLSSLCTSSKG